MTDWFTALLCGGCFLVVFRTLTGRNRCGYWSGVVLPMVAALGLVAIAEGLR